jgi:hypothetical protein
MSDELVPWQGALPETPAQRLTRQFYAWESRGRGWQVWPYAVDLEPPFVAVYLPLRPSELPGG